MLRAMTQLLDSIERHLERVRAIEAASISDAGVGPDLAHHEATLVALFERAETAHRARHRTPRCCTDRRAAMKASRC